MLDGYGDRLRVLLHGALASPKGDHLRPVKLLREVLGTANDLAGRPLCSAEDLAKRRGRGAAAVSTDEAARAATPTAAPVMIYFDGKDHRTRKKIEELLHGRDIPFRVLDCTDDESTRSWATAAAKATEFPLVFIAGEPVGGLHELTELDVNGGLKRRVFGA